MMRLIIADPDKDIRFFIRVCLRDYEVEIDEASDGRSCLEKLEGKGADIAVVNYVLDDMSGYETARNIFEKSIGKTKTIIATVEGFDLSIKKEYVTDYITKPFDEHKLVGVIQNILGKGILRLRKTEPENSKPHKINRGSKKKKILVADDDEQIIKLLTVLLKNKYEIESVMNGEELVKMAAEEQYDLIISDIIMPRLSGWKSVKELRDRGIDVPVLFNSGLVKDKELYETLKPAGRSAFLLKPFKKADLESVIEELLS